MQERGARRRASRRRRRATRSRSACTAPSGTRASSASSRRASRTATTARRSSSRAARDGELGAPAARSPASICATRSTSSPSARPGTISRFGGHAFAAGPVAARRRAGPLRRRRSRRSRREWLSPAQLRARIETDGALAAGELTLALAQTLRGARLGPGLPGTGVRRRRSTSPRSASSATSTRSSRSRAAASASTRSLFQHADAAAAADPRRVPPRGQPLDQGRDSLQLVDRALAAGLTRCAAVRKAPRHSALVVQCITNAAIPQRVSRPATGTACAL